jgi:hypothetical protein
MEKIYFKQKKFKIWENTVSSTKVSILFAQLNSMCLAEEWWLKKNIISILIIKIQTSY